MNKEQRKQQDSIETSIGIILTKVGYIEAEIKDIRAKLEKDYVTHDEFEPYRTQLKELKDFFVRILFVVLSAIILAVLGLIIVTP